MIDSVQMVCREDLKKIIEAKRRKKTKKDEKREDFKKKRPDGRLFDL